MTTVDYERYLFQLIEQERGETFDSFLVRLRCQIPKCKFSNEDSRLRGQIINKCALNKLREQAFRNGIALSQLISQAKILEEAEKGCGTQPERETLREDSRKCCTRCGFTDHEYFSSSCPAKNARCDTCKKLGHYARLCRTPNYARKRGRRDDSPDDRTKRCREESSQDPRSSAVGDARSQPTSYSGGTNKDETSKRVTADNGKIYINTNNSDASAESTSAIKNGTKQTAPTARSLAVPMVKIEPAVDDKAASNAEDFFVCTVGGVKMKLVLLPECTGKPQPKI